jgi:hypothetical protein
VWAAFQVHLGKNPLSGVVFWLANTDRTRLELLYRDGTGECAGGAAG